jgi:hypothetical protein
MQPTDIDPALALMAECGQVTKCTTRHINQLRQDVIFADGTVPARYMALAAMLWAVSARCEPCFKFYVGRWARHGQDRTLRIPRCRLHNGRVRRRDVCLEGLQGIQRPCERRTGTGEGGAKLLFLTTSCGTTAFAQARPLGRSA